MKFNLTYILIIVVSLLTTTLYAQSSFQKGYFIRNNGEKTECLIKNENWQVNPIEFEFKISENSSSSKLSVNSVKEFSIINEVKFVKHNVKIDISSTQVANLDYNKEPDWEEKEVFLNVIIEGQASLYSYYESGSVKYLYNLGEGEVLQLVYKRYKKSENELAENSKFRSQLFSSFFACRSLSKNNFDNLRYAKSSLVKLFNKYNSCMGGETNDFNSEVIKPKFNITPRIGYSTTSISLQHRHVPTLNPDFGSNGGLRFGIEGEVIFPKDRWGLLLGVMKNPDIDKTVTISTSSPNTPTQDVRLVFKSTDIFAGVRHYFSLSKDSKFSLQAGFNFETRSVVEVNFEVSGANDEDGRGTGFIFFGPGYHYNNFSIEGRIGLGKSMFQYNDSSFKSKVSDFNFTIGYTII